MTPVVLTIAGSDSGGGAGIQADLKTMAAHGVFGTSALTAITAQNTVGVQAVHPLPASLVQQQIRSVLEDFHVGAIKIGMLATAELASAVSDTIASFDGPVVLDPVMVATSGDRLLTSDAEEAIRHLALRCAVVTPNHPEAAVLAGSDDLGDIAAWAAQTGLRVLLTGGDTGETDIIDRLVQGDAVTVWRGQRVAGGPFHGTGCTLSSAIASRLALGDTVRVACEGAIQWVRKQVAAAEPLGSGSRVLLHSR